MYTNACPATRVEPIRVPTAFGTFHVERTGSRGDIERTVVLVHGFGTNASLWRGVGARLAHRGYLVLAPDLLGHGVSDWPPNASHTLESHADALAAAFTSLGVSHATVVGQDVGGLVAVMLAARYPDMVRQLVIVNPPDHSALPPVPVRTMQRAAQGFPDGAPDNRLHATAMVAALLAHSTGDPGQLPSATVARYLAPWLADGGAAQLRRLAHNLACDTIPHEALTAVVARTLVIRAERDRSVSSEVTRRLAETIPEAILRTFPDHGRLLGDDAPDELARAVLDFVRAPVNLVATPESVHA